MFSCPTLSFFESARTDVPFHLMTIVVQSFPSLLFETRLRVRVLSYLWRNLVFWLSAINDGFMWCNGENRFPFKPAQVLRLSNMFVRHYPDSSIRCSDDCLLSLCFTLVYRNLESVSQKRCVLAIGNAQNTWLYKTLGNDKSRLPPCNLYVQIGNGLTV